MVAQFDKIEVLKDAAATAIYGARGANGVILITTKSGSSSTGEASKNEITINSSYFNVEFASKPDYQLQYGNGFDQAFSGISKNSMGFWAQSRSIPYKGYEEGSRPIFKISDVDYIQVQASFGYLNYDIVQISTT